MSSQAGEVNGAIVYTVFPNTAARKKRELAETWPEIIERFRAPLVAREKSALPLLSFGVYGDTRTRDGNALRSAANLISITGIEGDYDGQKMLLEDAAERMGMAGIRCVLYTTPTHDPDAPKWRVIAPLSRAYPPTERARFVARANGILGGVLTRESFTLSQSFYFGRVEGRVYEVIAVEGDYIDLRDEFDHTAILPAGKLADDGGRSDATTDTELREAIRKGENLHESLRALSARFIGRGMNPQDVSSVLTGLMEGSTERGTDRWRERYGEIPRLVQSAAAKFSDRREAYFGEVESHSNPAGVTGSDQGEDDIKLVAFDKKLLLSPVSPERELIPGVPAEAYTLVAGGLATAKTTFLHTVMLARATGYDFLNMAPTGITPGPCVLVSYEDADSRIVRRFQILVQHQYAQIVESYGQKPGDEYLTLVARNVRRVTLTGKAGCGIVCRGAGANILPNHGLIDQLVTKVKAFASRDVLIGLDPLRLAIVGSQSDDDGADIVVHTLNDIASRLPDSGLIVPTHATKSGAIEPGKSQAAAAYSTSGSALYSQHARSNFLMSRLSPQEARSQFGVDEVTTEEIDRQRIVQLTHARLSHGPEAEPRFYAMRNGVLVPLRPNSQSMPLAEQARRALAAIYTVMIETTAQGHRVSRKALESAVAIGRTRHDRRDFIGECFDQGWLHEAGSTSDKHIEFTAAGRAQLSPSEDGESEAKAA